MPILHLCVCRLKAPEPPKARGSEVFLRYKGCPESDELCHSEPVLTSFAFPLGADAVQAKEYMASEEYTFTLTFGDGRRLQGFCRQFLPPAPRVGAKARNPLVLVLVAEFPWFNMFFKVLQVLEQLLRGGPECLLESNLADLPASSPAGALLQDLGTQLAMQPQAGQVFRITFPNSPITTAVSPPKMIGGGCLHWSDEAIDLQVPTDSGNGAWNRGIALARLLWHVPVPVLLTLFAALLLERRIILVSQARDTVTAAVQAAAALLYPFRWHHIYLPLLPKSFSDYLTAPMPYLVGLPAQMLPMLRGLSMDEVTLIDLDLGKCDPAPGSERDDAQHLPWRARLEAALTAAVAHLKSPTEMESSPLIASILQEYLLRLLGTYRRFVHEDGAPAASTSSAASPNGGGGGGGGGGAASQQQGSGAAGGGGQPQPQQSPRHTHHARSNSRDSIASRDSGRDHGGRDEALKGCGYYFDQQALVASYRNSERARRFLAMLRHSQLYEVFVQERLKMAADHWSPDAVAADPFELRAAAYVEQRRARLADRLRASPALQAKLTLLVRRYRRTGGEELAASLAGMQASAVAGGTAVGLLMGGTAAAAAGGTPPRPVDVLAFFEDDERELDDIFYELDPSPSPNERLSEAGSSTGNHFGGGRDGGGRDSGGAGGRDGAAGGGAGGGGGAGAASRAGNLARASASSLMRAAHELAAKATASASHSSQDPGSHAGGGGGLDSTAEGREGAQQQSQQPQFAGEGRVYEGSLGDVFKLAWRDIRGTAPGPASKAGGGLPPAAAPPQPSGGSGTAQRSGGSISSFFNRMVPTAAAGGAGAGAAPGLRGSHLATSSSASQSQPGSPTGGGGGGGGGAAAARGEGRGGLSAFGPRVSGGGDGGGGGGGANAAATAPALEAASSGFTDGAAAGGTAPAASTATPAVAADSLLGAWDPFGLGAADVPAAVAPAGADPFATSEASWNPYGANTQG